MWMNQATNAAVHAPQAQTPPFGSATRGRAGSAMGCVGRVRGTPSGSRGGAIRADCPGPSRHRNCTRPVRGTDSGMRRSFHRPTACAKDQRAMAPLRCATSAAAATPAADDGTRSDSSMAASFGSREKLTNVRQARHRVKTGDVLTSLLSMPAGARRIAPAGANADSVAAPPGHAAVYHRGMPTAPRAAPIAANAASHTRPAAPGRPCPSARFDRM
jgi:hypothetical protein